METVTEAFDTALRGPPHPERHGGPPRIGPGQRHFQCEVCRFMRDTGERASQCRCNWIECANPHCPAGRPEPDGRKLRLKSRFCQPTKCRFFKADDHA